MRCDRRPNSQSIAIKFQALQCHFPIEMEVFSSIIRQNVVFNFQHEPLDTARKQTRLLKLDSHLNSLGLVCCDVEIFDIAQAPLYQAASYEWGPAKSDRNICVNGRMLRIGRNLWLFLDVLRRQEAASEFFWIDQICIDQKNVAERNHQVQMIEWLRACWHGWAPVCPSTKVLLLGSKPPHANFPSQKIEVANKSLAYFAELVHMTTSILQQATSAYGLSCENIGAEYGSCKSCSWSNTSYSRSDDIKSSKRIY